MTYEQMVAACRRAIGLSPSDTTPLNRLSELTRRYFTGAAEASVYGLMFENLVHYVEQQRAVPEAADTQRLDLIQNTGEYPWKDYDCWKFRVGKERFTGATVRECLDAALASSKPQPQVGKDKP